MKTKIYTKPAALGFLIPMLLVFAMLPCWSATKWALLIAVSRVQAQSDVADAKYDLLSLSPGNNARQIDAEEMRKALLARGFDAKHIISLEEKQATRKAIQEQLDALKIAVQPEDTVVFYYSGHGGRVNDGLTLCPYDVSLSNTQNDLRDSELSSWLDELKTKNVIFILDCCFYQLPTKSVAHRAKFLPRADMSAPRPLAIPTDRAVVLQAAQDDGEAIEEAVGPAEWEGLFTQALTQELKTSVAGIAYDQLMGKIRNRVQNHIAKFYPAGTATQVPTLKAAPEVASLSLFAAPHSSLAPPPDTRVVYTPVKIPLRIVQANKTQVTLDHGSDFEVTKGSEYAVYPKTEKLFTGAHIIGTIRINDVNAGRASAEILDQGKHAKITPDCQAVEIKHANAEIDTSKVRVKVEAPENLRIELINALKALDYVDAENEPVDLIFKVNGDKSTLTGSLCGKDGVTPYPNSDQVKPFEANSAIGLVLQASSTLERFVAMRGWVNLQNPNPGFQIEMKSLRVDADGKEAETSNFQIGDVLKVGVKLHTDKSCYLALIHVDATGIPTLLFPSNGVSGQIVGNHEYTIPSRELTPGFDHTFTASSPTGRDTIVAIATSEPIDWERLTLPKGKETFPEMASKGINDTQKKVQNSPLSQWAMALINFVTVDKLN